MQSALSSPEYLRTIFGAVYTRIALRPITVILFDVMGLCLSTFASSALPQHELLSILFSVCLRGAHKFLTTQFMCMRRRRETSSRSVCVRSRVRMDVGGDIIPEQAPLPSVFPAPAAAATVTHARPRQIYHLRPASRAHHVYRGCTQIRLTQSLSLNPAIQRRDRIV